MPGNLFSRRLYLRIWLAIAGGLLVLMLLIGWAWRVTAEAIRPPPSPIPRATRRTSPPFIG